MLCLLRYEKPLDTNDDDVVVVVYMYMFHQLFPRWKTPYEQYTKCLPIPNSNVRQTLCCTVRVI